MRNYSAIMENMEGGSIDDQRDKRNESLAPSKSVTPSSLARMEGTPNTKGSDLGGAATTAGAATGNPYLLATGMTLSTVSKAKERKMARPTLVLTLENSYLSLKDMRAG